MLKIMKKEEISECAKYRFKLFFTIADNSPHFRSFKNTLKDDLALYGAVYLEGL